MGMRLSLRLSAIVVSVVLVGGSGLAFAADLPSYVFDMGTGDSPLFPGATRITGESVYRPETGYGWETGPHRSFTAEPPTEDLPYIGARQTVVYAENVNDLNGDGVADQNDMVFRVDLPNGTYRVCLSVGNMRRILGSMQVYANDQLIRKNVEVRYFRWRGSQSQGYGWFNPIRFTFEVKDRVLRLRLHGDDSEYRRLLAIENTKRLAPNYLSREDLDRRPGDEVLPTDIGQPFVENSVLSIEIRPAAVPPILVRDEQLAVNLRSPSAELARAVALFNQGDFEGSYAAAEKVSRATETYARACLYLWLAGRPEFERELELAPKAEELLARVVRDEPGDSSAAELFWLAQRFRDGAFRFTHRFDSGKNAYGEAIAASMDMKFLQPDDPMYWKGQIYRGRIYFMLNPPRQTWVAGAGKDILEEVQKKFPNNRYVRYYLDGVWPETADWHVNDYSRGTEGVPAWAVAAREARRILLDMAEWWIVNKQKPEDGTLGVGYGDDVELIVDFANYAFVDPGANKTVLEGVARLAEGNWQYSGLDKEAGFWWEPADVGHSAEFTADTLPMMMYLDYGNPVWIERGLKNGKLMRDLWTGINPRGHRHFRSNFVGGLSMGGGLTTNDSWANYRAAIPVAAVLSYNNLPELARLFDEWARAMLEDSMKTDRGKPAGVMPSNVAFADCTLGGVDSPAWYVPNSSPGTVNPGWNAGQDFHYKPYYHMRLLGEAYERTGDDRFLEPFRLEAELAQKYLANPIDNPPEGSEAWVGKMLAGTQASWEENAVVLWEEVQKAYRPGQGPARLLTTDEAYRICDLIRRKVKADWPINTTEALATDRVGFGGIADVTTVFTGGFIFPLQDAKVSFVNAGANLASCVVAADRRHLHVLLYSFDPSPKEIGIRPWHLQPGAVYSVRMGPDQNGDDAIDGAVTENTLALPHRAVPFYLTIPSRTQIVVQLDQVKAGAGAKTHSPDLGATEADLEYDPARSLVVLTVHNIGSASADNVIVELYDGDPAKGGRKIGSNLISHLDPPNSLVPQTIRVGFELPEDAVGRLTLYAIVDPKNEIPEITESNNSVTRTLDRGKPSPGAVGATS